MAKRTFRVVRKNRKSRRRIKGGDDTIPKVPSSKYIRDKSLKKGIEIFRKHLPDYPNINQTVRFHILKYRQNQLKCKKSRFESMSLTRKENKYLNDADKAATCDDIKLQLNDIRTMQGMFGKLKRNIFRYGLMRLVINMTILSRLHHILYNTDFSKKNPKMSSAAKYFFFRNCGQKPDQNDFEIDEKLLNNINIQDTNVSKLAKDSDNEANGIDVPPIDNNFNLKDRAQALYAAETNEFPDCGITDRLTVIEHETLMEFYQTKLYFKGGMNEENVQSTIMDIGNYLTITGMILVIIGVLDMTTEMLIDGNPSGIACVISGVILFVIGGFIVESVRN